MRNKIINKIKRNLSDSKEFFREKDADDPLFLSRNGKPLTTRAAALQLKSIGCKAGVRKEVMHPHAFRHYFAIKMLKATGNDISLVSSYLGHSNIATIAIYTMRTKDEQVNLLNSQMSW